MKKTVTIVDYGVGNLLNVIRAFEHIGARVNVAETGENILAADRLVLPGVGAFREGMKVLKDKKFDLVIKEYAEKDKALLGICLGMQMLFDSSDEFGYSEGLGLIAGKVVAIPGEGVAGNKHKIPHIGWNELLPHNANSWESSIYKNLEKNSAAYFVHSFMGVPDDDSFRLANCDYDGVNICATVHRDNIIGCQFHPEKSGQVGLDILRNFLN